MKIGVLALQGAFAKHIAMTRSLGVDVKEVRKPADLEGCDALIIPGGESTTITYQLNFIKLSESIKNFAKTNPIFGTCAGLILMSEQILGDTMVPFGMLNISVERNAFGRQAESFKTNIIANLSPNSSKETCLPAIFIRAPRIRKWAPSVQILSKYENEPILIRQGCFLGATFHPELTDNSTIHQYFLKMVYDHMNDLNK